MALPPLEEILLELPLYAPQPLESSDREAVEALTADRFRFDGYCIDCDDRTIFYDNRAHHFSPAQAFAERVITLTARCGRVPDHTLTFYLLIQPKRLTKIGQYPSHADLSNPGLKKYQKILGQERAGELHRAIGLAAHGVGIGSYAYLRRIFEDLLSQHRPEAEARSGRIDGYEGMRVDEKIQALRDTLPEALVRNKTSMVS